MHTNGGQQSFDGRTPAVVVSDLSYRYPGQALPALQAVSMTIAAGSCFGLLGPNGAGKTTLISLLTGVLRRQDGEIVVSPPAGGDRSSAAVSLVPQEYAFYPTLTGRENLEFFCGLYGIAGDQRRGRIDECADICALQDVLDRRAQHYSGGIKRRLNLAIALLCRPAVLYLDEPTVGIDAQSRRFILEGIEGLKSRGMTIVYTSHYMEEVERLCDEVAIIDHGRLLLQQRMDDLLGTGARPGIRPLQPLSADQLAACTGSGLFSWDGEWLRLNRDGASLSAALALLEAQGIAVADIQLGRHRLEELYLSITQHALRD